MVELRVVKIGEGVFELRLTRDEMAGMTIYCGKESLLENARSILSRDFLGEGSISPPPKEVRV